jgi:hypothetical protein
MSTEPSQPWYERYHVVRHHRRFFFDMFARLSGKRDRSLTTYGTYPDEAVVELQADKGGEDGAVLRGAVLDDLPDDGLGSRAGLRVEVELQRRCEIR